MFLLGHEAQVEGFLDELRDRDGVVELGKGRWTIGEGVVVTITSGSIEAVSCLFFQLAQTNGDRLTIDRVEI